MKPVAVARTRGTPNFPFNLSISNLRDFFLFFSFLFFFGGGGYFQRKAVFE
jgi:hypothetical protein